MIKIIIFVLVIASTSYIGIKASNKYKKKIEIFFDFISFCNSYEANLDFFQNNLNDFINDFSKTASKEFGNILMEKFNLSYQPNNINLLFDHYTHIINNEQMGYINNFLSILGKSDVVSQKKQIETYKYYFIKEYENAKATYEKKGKAYGKLGILSGFFIIILMV